ncbi:MAG TPA: ACT domain-containing protein [Thermoplasmata archaeon]|nr:ACT domain-containing protein [Thermoplasmata archaeon]
MVLREISVTLPNRPGALAGVARTLAEERINLAAIGADSSQGRGRLRLIVNDPDRAMRLLAAAGYEPEVREMLAVRLEDRAGSFLRVLEVLAAEGVNIQSVAILVAREGNRPLVALSSNDLSRARRLLQRAGFVSRAAEGLVSNNDLLASAPSIPGESVGLLL